MSSVVTLHMAYPFRGPYSRPWMFADPQDTPPFDFGNPQLLIITRRPGPFNQDIDQASDDVERCTELMADAGDKVGFAALGFSAGNPFQVHLTTDQAAALANADFLTTQIRVGRVTAGTLADARADYLE